MRRSILYPICWIITEPEVSKTDINKIWGLNQCIEKFAHTATIRLTALIERVCGSVLIATWILPELAKRKMFQRNTKEKGVNQMRSLTQKTDFFDAIEYVEDILKDWDIYRLIIEDVGNYPGIEKYRKVAHIMKCIENRNEFLSSKECAYLELKYFKKKSYQEIAKKLNIKPRTVANWRIRILYKIAKRGGLI